VGVWALLPGIRDFGHVSGEILGSTSRYKGVGRSVELPIPFRRAPPINNRSTWTCDSDHSAFNLKVPDPAPLRRPIGEGWPAAAGRAEGRTIAASIHPTRATRTSSVPRMGEGILSSAGRMDGSGRGSLAYVTLAYVTLGITVPTPTDRPRAGLPVPTPPYVVVGITF